LLRYADGRRRNPDRRPIGWVEVPYSGQRYAREAVRAVIAYGFGTLGLPAIRAITDPKNAASQKVLLARGLKKIADLDLAEPMRRGAKRVPLFRIARNEYRD
jgi:RimJ/RimL family protein N-acetyltransferase